MASNVNKLEILSPAKNLFYAKEAIKCGADAIYMGPPKFGMRSHATNSIEDFKTLVEYAHRYWVKVYVTLNCLLYTDDDIKQNYDMINEFYNMGVDGIIIQDLGLLELDLPPIPIILSTTVRCHTKEDAQFFEKCGVDRIVLTRELSFDEIKDITENSNIKIEAFCYGFLCSGFNGNCYVTYVENLKRSGSSEYARYQAANHGVCFARCMGHWTLKDADNNTLRENDRLLNLRFLDLEERLGDLFDIGVDSFKIEGRERDLKYVKNATAIFNNRANQVVKERNARRSSSGRSILGFVPGKYKTFNKGFTDYFLTGRKKEMYSNYEIVGEEIGKVTDFDGKSFSIQTDITLNIGDKFRYKISDLPVKTLEITDIKDGRYYIEPVEDDITSLTLYRYHNEISFSEIENSVNYRVISVSLKFENDGDNYKISATDEDDNKIQLNYKKGTKLIKAENIQNELYEIKEDCEFVVDKADSAIDIFIDDINQMKNEIFLKLREEREKNRPRYTHQVVKNNVPYHKKELTYLSNVNNKYTESFWRRHGVEKLEYGFETLSDIKDKRAFTGKYCIRHELGYCPKKDNTDNMPKLPWTIQQCESKNKYEIKFDCDNCLMYFYSVN